MELAKDVAASIFLKIEPFAEYGFNKSHAAAYAIISYQTAFLKTYYPKEFFAASMTMDISNQNKLGEFHEELKRINIKLYDQILISVLQIFNLMKIIFIML